jgi:hypothetical protein
MRRLMPEMPVDMKNQRLLFFGATLRSTMAMREGALADISRPHRMWGSNASLKHLAQVLTAMLEAPYYKPDLTEVKGVSDPPDRVGLIRG